MTRTLTSEVGQLRQKLAEAKNALSAMANGELDSVTETSGPVLLRAAQESLWRSEANFRSLIEHLPDQVWVHTHGIINYVNPNVVACLGYQRADELVGRDLIELVVPDDRERVEARLRDAPILTDKKNTYEFRLRHRSGGTVFIEASTQAILFNGKQVTLKVARDITERKRLEGQLLAADRMISIGMLAAGVAHEINNPLAFVIANLGFAALELSEGMSSQPRVWDLSEAAIAIKEAQDGAERVRVIVRDLKSLSRSDDQHRGRVDVAQMLDSTANIAGNEIRHRARLIKHYPPAPLFVEGSVARLSQVFLNLLINAAQSIPEGDATHNEIRLAARRHEDGRVVIEVGDSGAGMTADVQLQMYTPFFTTKPKGAGTGLGLSICHQIITSHGGEIEVESELGVGTTFRVYLPSADLPTTGAKGAPKPLAPVRRAKVLVIDDEPMMGTVMCRLLKPHHDARSVTSGKEALALLAHDSTFDVIFCDLMMPEMAGPEVYQAIAAIDPALAKRVVFLSGGVFTEKGRVFISQTPNPVIEKPFEPARILAAVATIVTAQPLPS